MNGEEYELIIDAFTPSTIPMSRLAEYMRELAFLMGNPGSVHFKGLKSGSVRLVARIEREAVPKVRQRLQSARDPDAPADIRRPYQKLDDMLRDDNGVGKLVRGTTNVVRFPGREAARNERMGPFTEHAEFDGKIVRIGGQDQTAHALLEDTQGEIISAECSRELAVQLAKYLYGSSVRLIGNARWERTEIGRWELKSFRAKEFLPIKTDSLTTIMERLQGLNADWQREGDPAALVRRLRGGADEED